MITFKTFVDHVREIQRRIASGHGISRDKLPQIPSDAQSKFFAWLKDKFGIETVKVSKPAEAFSPSQGEFNLPNVIQIVYALLKGTFREYSIVSSKGGTILDGHHRWIGVFLHNPQDKMLPWEVQTDFPTLLKHARAFPGASYKVVGDTSPPK